MSIRRSRVLIALLLISLVPFCYWSEVFFFCAVVLATFQSFRELCNLGVPSIQMFIYLFPIFALASSPVIFRATLSGDLRAGGSLNRDHVMLMVVFTQTSDIFQFLGGKLSAWIFGKVMAVLHREVGNFKLEFKNMKEFGFQNAKELTRFLDQKVKTFCLFETSPNKTILGYTLGFWACLTIFTWVFPILEWKNNIVWFLAGCAGDLYASSIKRQYGAKDFSGLLGPHGGLLDRFDSTLGVLHLNYWGAVLRYIF